MHATKTTTLKRAERLLQTQQTKNSELQKLLIGICEVTGRTAEEIRSTCRRRDLSDVRQIFCYISAIANKSFLLSEVGDFINRDHATVLHARRTVENLMSTDKNFRKRVQAIATQLGIENRNMSNTDKGEALELLEFRIAQLHSWMAAHSTNPFRVKVLEDIRDLERQKSALCAGFNNETNHKQ